MDLLPYTKRTAPFFSLPNLHVLTADTTVQLEDGEKVALPVLASTGSRIYTI